MPVMPAELPVTLDDATLLWTASHIGGAWDEAREAGDLVVRDPATGAALARLTALGAEGAGRAVDAASRAFPGWAALLPQDRRQR